MIRKAKNEDLNEILRIYEIARDFMHTHGNPTQWAGKYPDKKTLINDIKIGQLYVITVDNNEGRLCGCFAMIPGVDPTYINIYEGEWKNDKPYAAIHRVASDGTLKGVFARCFEYASEKYDHLRIDTHKDNLPMQGAVKKCGFEYCGIIYLADGAPRIAFEWTKE